MISIVQNIESLITKHPLKLASKKSKSHLANNTQTTLKQLTHDFFMIS
jgi:hypothetical protein